MAKKPRHKFTTEELKRLEALYARSLKDESISALMGFSDTWFTQLAKTKTNCDSVQLAKRLGRAKAKLKVLNTLWEKADEGHWPAIKFILERIEGYSETSKVELSGPNGGPMESAQLTKEELKERVLALRKLNDLTSDE